MLTPSLLKGKFAQGNKSVILNTEMPEQFNNLYHQIMAASPKGFPGIKPEQADSIRNYLSNPTFDNWDSIAHIIIPNKINGGKTIWQSVNAIDKGFPRVGRSENEAGRVIKEWAAKPSPETVVRAIKNQIGEPESEITNPQSPVAYDSSAKGESVTLNTTDLTKMVSDNEKHIKYVPVSNACGYDLGTVVPKGMAQEMYNALHEVKKQLELRFGLDLDGYVQDRLQFTPEELGVDRVLYDKATPAEQVQMINDNLCTVFAPEQIDAIALAIYNIEIRKQGMIEGDMTGIGKGRVAAAIIRYCIKYLKKTPIFLTEKTYLFSDIYRDLIDIASDLNIPYQVKVDEVRKEIKMTKAQMANRIKELMENGDTREEAVEKVEELSNLGFEMVPVYDLNKKYDEQVRRAKKTRMQCIPFIINNADSMNRVKNLNGDILYFAQRNSDESFKHAIAKHTLPQGYDLIMTTYSQLRGMAKSAKMEWFQAMCQDTVVICDESHNASGDSNTGRFLLTSLETSRSAIFLSATYAKRADNMVIYGAKTSMRETGLPKNDLILAIDNGGVPLQEIISSQLVAEGQMIRRERTYAGVDVFYNILDESMDLTGHPEFNMADKHKAIADVFTSILRDVIELQSVDVAKWTQKADVAKKFLKEEYGEVEISKGFSIEKALTSSPMFSRVFNLINQLLFSIKAEAIADRAITYLQQGKKPVISFANTMESFMDTLTNDDDMPLSDGDLISSDFKRVLEKLLDNIFFVTIKSPTGDKTKIRLELNQFPLEIQAKYTKIKQDIKQISIGIAISPIDVLLKKIREAGFTVEEITGRAGRLNYTDDTFKYATYERRIKPSPTDTFRGFNQNKIDCVLLNQSGATGGSIHAAPNAVVNRVRVKDSEGNISTVPYNKNLTEEIIIPDSLEPRDEIKQRVMIILQPELNINTEVQKRGRIFRSGQVLPPMYDYMSTAIPAEKRLQMMLQRKLQSLDSNTSANQKQSDNLINIVDFLNKYGDVLVIKYLKENQRLIFKLGDPLKMWDESKKQMKETPGAPDNAAYRVSGRVAILSVSEQERFYNELSERYADYVKLLKSMNEYDLEVEYLDLHATAVEKEVFIVGTGGTSLFGRNSIMERCQINNLRKPYTQAELDLMLQDELQEFSGYNDPGKQQQRSILDEHEKFHTQRQANLITDYEEYLKNSLVRLESDKKYIQHQSKFPEEAKKWMTTMKTEVEKKNAEDYAEDKAEMEKRYVYIRDFLKKIYTGMVTNYVKGEIKVRAVVTGIDIDRRRNNPWTPGNIRIKMAIANGVRLVVVPLTNEAFIREIISETEVGFTEQKSVLKQWNKLTKESAHDRVERYIITGNILQAMANENVVQYGRLVKFTTDNKKMRNGILMTDEFNPSTGEGRGAVVKIPIRFCLPILDNMSASKGTRYITTDGIEITKKNDDLDFIIKVRKNKDSNPIILNTDILSMVNEKKGFADMGTIPVWDQKEQVEVNYPAMGASIDRDNMQAFLDYLSKNYNSCLKVGRAIFDKEKELLGIDFKTDYEDGKQINESESGLAQVAIDIDDPLYQKVVEAQQDPVSMAGEQVIVEPEQGTVEIAPVAEGIAELEKDKAIFAVEKKLLKLYKMLLPFVPEKKDANFKDEGDFYVLAVDKDGNLVQDIEEMVPVDELDNIHKMTFATKEEATAFAEANGWNPVFEFENGGSLDLNSKEIWLDIGDNYHTLFDVEDSNRLNQKTKFLSTKDEEIDIEITPSFEDEPKSEKGLATMLNNDIQSWVEDAERFILKQFPTALGVGFNLQGWNTTLPEYKKTGKIQIQVTVEFELPIKDYEELIKTSKVEFAAGGPLKVGDPTDFGMVEVAFRKPFKLLEIYVVGIPKEQIREIQNNCPRNIQTYLRNNETIFFYSSDMNMDGLLNAVDSLFNQYIKGVSIPSSMEFAGYQKAIAISDRGIVITPDDAGGKFEEGGAIDSTWQDISNVNPSKITVRETQSFGNPDKLILEFNGKKLAQFYYNMRGYNADFFLKNKEGVQYGFGGDRSKTEQVSTFKRGLKEGFTFIKFYNQFASGGDMASDKPNSERVEIYKTLAFKTKGVAEKNQKEIETYFQTRIIKSEILFGKDERGNEGYYVKYYLGGNDFTLNDPLAIAYSKNKFASGGAMASNFTDAEKKKIEEIIQSNAFMSLQKPLEDAGFTVKVEWNDMPMPPVMYKITKGNHAIVILNKRYADDADFVYGEIAMGQLYAQGGALGQKLYTKAELLKKFNGKFIDTYPHHHEFWDENAKPWPHYTTVYEVRGVSSKIKENFQTPEEVVEGMASGGSIHHGSGLGMYTVREKIKDAYESAGIAVDVKRVHNGWDVIHAGNSVYLPDFHLAQELEAQIRLLPINITGRQLGEIMREFENETVSADFEKGGILYKKDIKNFFRRDLNRLIASDKNLTLTKSEEHKGRLDIWYKNNPEAFWYEDNSLWVFNTDKGNIIVEYLRNNEYLDEVTLNILQNGGNVHGGKDETAEDKMKQIYPNSFSEKLHSNGSYRIQKNSSPTDITATIGVGETEESAWKDALKNYRIIGNFDFSKTYDQHTSEMELAGGGNIRGGKNETVTLQPYQYGGWNYPKQLVWVDTKHAHPDPMRKMIWGDGKVDATVSDFKGFFTPAGQRVTVNYWVPDRLTSNQEKQVRSKAIWEYVHADDGAPYPYAQYAQGGAIAPRPLHDIAAEISEDWKHPDVPAQPYLSAMFGLDSINDKYGMDPGSDIVAYFLSNAGHWKGEKARAIKKELNDMLKHAKYEAGGSVSSNHLLKKIVLHSTDDDYSKLVIAAKDAHSFERETDRIFNDDSISEGMYIRMLDAVGRTYGLDMSRYRFNGTIGEIKSAILDAAKNYRISIEMENGGNVAYGEFGSDHLAWYIANLVYDYHYSGISLRNILSHLKSNYPEITEQQIADKIKNVLSKHGYVWDGAGSDAKIYYKAFYEDGGSMSEGKSQDQAKVFIEGYPWWLRRLDHTHLWLSNEETKKGTPFHIGQLYNRKPFATNQFYKDVDQWISGKLDINGRTYDSFEDGGTMTAPTKMEFEWTTKQPIETSLRSELKLKDGTIYKAGTPVSIRFGKLNGYRWIIEATFDKDKVYPRIIKVQASVSGEKFKAVEKAPSLKTIERWTFDSENVRTMTGDDTEPDGIGEDGAPSWLLVMGMMEDGGKIDSHISNLEHRLQNTKDATEAESIKSLLKYYKIQRNYYGADKKEQGGSVSNNRLVVSSGSATFTKCPVGTEIQTLILSKERFKSQEDAIAWVAKNIYMFNQEMSVDEKENTYRIRQQEPENFAKDSFRTIELTEGVKAVIGCPKDKKAQGGDLKSMADELLEKLYKELAGLEKEYGILINLPQNKTKQKQNVDRPKWREITRLQNKIQELEQEQEDADAQNAVMNDFLNADKRFKKFGAKRMESGGHLSKYSKAWYENEMKLFAATLDASGFKYVIFDTLEDNPDNVRGMKMIVYVKWRTFDTLISINEMAKLHDLSIVYVGSDKVTFVPGI